MNSSGCFWGNLEFLVGICFTAHHVRSPLRLRTAFVGRNKEELLDALQRYYFFPLVASFLLNYLYSFIDGQSGTISHVSTTPPKVIVVSNINHFTPMQIDVNYILSDEVSSREFGIAHSLYSSLRVFKDAVISTVQQIGGNNSIISWIEQGLPASTLEQRHLVSFVVQYPV